MKFARQNLTYVDDNTRSHLRLHLEKPKEIQKSTYILGGGDTHVEPLRWSRESGPRRAVRWARSPS